jgi:hypothetical protein
MVTRAKTAFPPRSLALENDPPPDDHEFPLTLPEADDEDETATDRVARMLQTASGDDRAKLIVYRVIGPNKYAWCCEYSVADFEAGSYGLLRRDWGSGEYQIRLYATKPGTNYFGVRAKENVTIEKGLQEPTQHVSQQSNELAQMLGAMAETQNRMLQALTEKPAPVDPMANMAQMFSMLKLMKEAMPETPKQEKSSIAEIMEAVREMRAVSAELVPEKDEVSDPLMAAIPGMLELIKNAQGAQQPQQPQVPTVFHPVSLPASVAPTEPRAAVPTEPGAAPTAEDAATQSIAEMLQQLVNLARMNVSAETASEMVYEAAPDEVFMLLRAPGWFDALPTILPAVTEHRAWFEEVGRLALAAMDADANNEAQAGELSA